MMLAICQFVITTAIFNFWEELFSIVPGLGIVKPQLVMVDVEKLSPTTTSSATPVVGGTITR
jgi:hypothetical protein